MRTVSPPSSVPLRCQGLPQARKIIDDKPGDLRDQCSDGLGQVVPGQVCQAVVQAYATPRMVAGESIATDVNKCRLEPLTRSAYRGVQFTDGQWGILQRAFPTGVCDWSAPGVSQAPTVPWLTYQGRSGGQPLGHLPGRWVSGTNAIYLDRDRVATYRVSPGHGDGRREREA